MSRRRIVRVLVIVALLALLVVVLRRQAAGPAVEPGSTLVLSLEGRFVEGPEPSLVARLLGRDQQPFVGLLSTLGKAERDERLSTVVLKIGNLGIGWGKAQELRDAIGRLRAAGRKTIAYLELVNFGANREYYVASAADQVYANPGAIVPVVGLAADYLFLGGLWEKLGVGIESERIGRYKSAVDFFTGREMSDSNREMANSLLDSIYTQFVSGIAESRKLEPKAVQRTIDTGLLAPRELEAQGLIDGVRPLDQLEAMSAPVVEGEDYAGVSAEAVGFDPQARFALVYGAGSVVSGKGRTNQRGEPVFASETVSDALDQAAEDPDIAAIILRIDSPGGSAMASEVIWEACRKARESGKPLIASYSDVAASGGYYASVASDGIVAPAGVLTGSIGVFVLRPVLGGLFDKLGVGYESLHRGAHADLQSMAQPLSPQTRQRLRKIVTDTYDLFVERVSEGRSLERARVDELGRGRVWTGAQAAERGLVDELGGLHAAVQRAKRQLGLAEDADVVLLPYPKPRSLAEEIAEFLPGLALAVQTPLPLPEAAVRAWSWLAELPVESPLLVPPLWVDVH